MLAAAMPQSLPLSLIKQALHLFQLHLDLRLLSRPCLAQICKASAASQAAELQTWVQLLLMQLSNIAWGTAMP